MVGLWNGIESRGDIGDIKGAKVSKLIALFLSRFYASLDCLRTSTQ